MAEIKRDIDTSQSEVEIPVRYTKEGKKEATILNGTVVKEGVPYNNKIFKILQTPQRFYGKNGLEDIDLNLTDCTGKYFEFEYICENNLIKSAFNDNAGDHPLASFIIKSDDNNKEKWINYKPYDCADVDGVVTDNAIKYSDAYTDTDIEYKNLVNNIKQFITLKSSSAPTAFDFTIKTCKEISLVAGILPILNIQYTGASEAGTIEVTTNNHIIGRTAAATAFDLDTTNASYDTLAEVATYINNLSTWTATLNGACGSCRSKTLSVQTETDSKTNIKILDAALKNVIAVNPDQPNSRTYWQIKRPFAISDRTGSDTSNGFVELIPASEHANETYDVIRITTDPTWVSDEFTAGATEIVIDPTTYRIIRDYGNITFLGDYASGNQHGADGFMNGYGLINRGTEATQAGGTRVENDNALITYVDPDGTEYAGGASTKGSWIYSASGSFSGNSSHYSSENPNAKIKLTFTGTEIWLGCIMYPHQAIVDVYIDNIFYGSIDRYNSIALYQQKLLLATGLANSSHTIELVVSDQENINGDGTRQIHFDFFEYYTSGNELASKDAITINSRATYGLDCTYAKHPLGIQYDARGNLYNDTGGDPAKGSFSCWVKPNFDYDADTNSHWIMGKEAGAEVAGDMRLYYHGPDDKFHLSIYNGADWSTVDVESAAQTFSSGDVLHILVTWNETTGANLFVDNVKTTDSSTWTAVDLAGNIIIGNDIISPSAIEQADMIIAEPTIFDYVLTDEEIYDIYTSTKFIGDMDFGRRVEVLNRTNKGMLFNYSGVVGADHRTGSFAGKLYDTSAPSGTAVVEGAITYVGNWFDGGNYRATDVGYATYTFPACTEIWACFYAGTDRGIAEYILDEGTSKEKHVLIDQYHSSLEDRYALIATGLENTTHTIKIKKKELKNISSTSKGIYIGLNGSADKMYYYATSGSENISSDSLIVNNRLIDNVLDCNYTDMPNAITFPDKGNISEYDHEGTIKCWVKTTWAGDDGVHHYIFDTRGAGGLNGMFINKLNSNTLKLYFANAATSIETSSPVNSTNWAANTEHHILVKWWRPTTSTMGLTIYLDGVKLAENKSQSFTPTSHSGILIGNYFTPSTNDFEGNIYDLSIHNHAMNDGGIAVSASAASGSEVYNSYHSIARKYKEDLSDQVGNGSTTTFFLERGLILQEAYAKVLDDTVEATISSIKEGTFCRTNGAISATDTTIVVDSWTNAESEIDINGGYLWIGGVNSLWRKKIEYSAYDAGTNTFTVANSGTVGEDFVDNTIIEVCGTVTLSAAPAEDSVIEAYYYYSGDSVDREYGGEIETFDSILCLSKRVNKNLWLDITGNGDTGWCLYPYNFHSGSQSIYSRAKGQTNLFNTNKSNIIASLREDTSFGISQLIINQGTKNEKCILIDVYNSSNTFQNLYLLVNGLPRVSILRTIIGVDKNASSSGYYNFTEAFTASSQYDLTKDALNSNDVNCVFDYSAIRVVDGQLDYDKDKSGNLQLAEALDATEQEIDIDTDTAADLDRLGRPYGIIKVDSEFIYYEDIDFTSSTTATLHNCKRGYLAELTGGTAATHTDDTAIQLVGAWRNNQTAMNQSWYSSDGAFPYRALLIGCGTEASTSEGGLIIRDLDQNKNYMIFETDYLSAVRAAVMGITAHTGKIVIVYGTWSGSGSDIDFIRDTIIRHGVSSAAYGNASVNFTISQRNEGLDWSTSSPEKGLAIPITHHQDCTLNFDGTNYNLWICGGKSGTTGSSAGIVRIYDGGDGLLDTEYDLDADTSYWATRLVYDIANDDLYVVQTDGVADHDIWSKIGSPKITGDSTIDTADGSDRLTSQAICNDITLEDTNVWMASDSGAKEILKASFSSGVTNTLDNNDFGELSIDICKAIDYDPDNEKLLLGFQNGSDGLLIKSDTDAGNPEYYDKISENDIDRNNVLSSDIVKSVCNIYEDYRTIENYYTAQGDNGFVVGTDVGITIGEPEGVEWSTYVDEEIVKSGEVYTQTIVGVGNRRETIISKDVNNVYTRILDEDPNEAPFVSKIIEKDVNNVYSSTDQT